MLNLVVSVILKMKQHPQIALLVALLISYACASIYPDGEDKEAWDARINGKIDKLHKRDVTLLVTLTDDEVSKHHSQGLRLRVNQTRTPIPFGKQQKLGTLYWGYEFIYIFCFKALPWLTTVFLIAGCLARMIPTVLLPGTTLTMAFHRMQ